MLRASKLWKSSSISGPDATSKPARRNNISMRRRALVTGCRPPRSSPRPGRVTSMRPAASFCSTSARSSSARRASRAALTRSLASLMRWPAAGRSDLGKAPSACSCSVSVPFFPSHRTRTSSNDARSPRPATSSSACWMSEVRSCNTYLLSSGDSESGLRLLRDRAKRVDIVYGDIGEHLAVDLDSSLQEAVDDPAIAQTVDARSSVDTRDPQSAELALLRAPVAVSVLAGLDDRLLRYAINLAPGVVIALRLTKNFLVTAPGRHATFDSCHVRSASVARYL